MTMLTDRIGVVPRTISVGAGPWAIEVGTKGRAFVADTAGDSVTVIDTARGVVIRTFAVGANPSEVTVDDQTGTAFAANTKNSTISVLSPMATATPHR